MTVSTRPRVAPTLVSTAMLWLTMAIAASALWPIYRSTEFVVLVAVALPVGSLIAILGALLRWNSAVVMLVSVAAFLLVGVPLAVPSQAQFGVLPTLTGIRDLVLGVALGWKQLLTISLPVGSYQALLVPALVLVLFGTVIGLTVALRAKRRELAVLVPVVVFLVATAFGPQYPERAIEAPIALLVAALLWLVWMRLQRRRSAIRLLAAQSLAAAQPGRAAQPGDDRGSGLGFAALRTALGALLIMAIASASAVAAVGVLPPVTDRSVLRTSIQQPFDPRDYVSPLAGFRSYLKPPTVDSVLFSVTGLPEGDRVRLATLDSYDGVVYSVGSDQVSSESGSFTRVPSRVDQSGLSGERVTVEVVVSAYSGVWLPSVGQLESIDFSGPRAAALDDSFYYNDVSGTAAVIAQLSAGDGYSLTGVIPRQPGQDELASLEPGSASVPEPAVVPEELTARLEEYTSGVQGAGQRLQAMLDGLARDGYISHGVSPDEPPSRSGHAADRIAELFSQPRMIGDAEQYSVAAALMARTLGFPARVVLGFVPRGDQVRGEDISAWIEVNTAQYGWVTIDPTPPLRPIPEEEPQDSSQVSRPPTIVTPPLVESEDFDRQATPDSQQELPPNLDPVLQALMAVLRVLGWVVLAVAILLAPFLVVIAAKLRRRRLRFRAADPLRRISGGWQQFEDVVIDHGLAPGPAATRSEVASVAGGVQSQLLAAVADRAVFAPEPPSEAEADRVWRAVDELERTLDSGLSRWQRLRARISLRSLGGYSGRKLFRR